MKQSDQTIILSTTKFGENSVILHCLSKTYGRCGMMVKSAARLSSFFQPLGILDCDVAVNPKSALLNASGFSSAHPLAGIRGNFAKNAISMFMAEVLFRALREGDSGPRHFAGNGAGAAGGVPAVSPEDAGLYDWCVSEILLLDALERDYANFHLRFLMDFAAALGFSPSPGTLLPFMDGTDAGADNAGVSSAAVARAMLDGNFADSMLIRLSGAQRTAFAARLLKYLEAHLESPLHIRSLSVLSELFA